MANFPQQIGNYKLERQIGKGGMSQVWLARHRTLEDRLVAIKLLVNQDPEWEDRFNREANITSRLRHECIVQIYDHGYHAPYHYTVMEYVPGGALRDVLRERRPLPLETALTVFRRAGAALDYAHAHGVIHRDVSPGNILIEQGTGRVMLTDFGIARETGKTGMTTINKVMGTPGYLSPEHASSATAVTHLSDLYCLGIVLFEMLSGALPWDHNPGMADATGGPFTPTKTLRERGVEGLPYEVDRVLQTMLALDPAKRYPTAQAAADELDRVLRRHTMTTTIISTEEEKRRRGEEEKRRLGGSLSSSPLLPFSPSIPAEPHAVEKVLGLDLLKVPMQESRRLAEQLADPQEIALLLNQWSREGVFRRKLLGRQATVRRVLTQNIYFYTLRVLFETREPEKVIEEPDYKALPIPLERELDRWSVELPAPKGFADEAGGTLRLPGSMRVISCEGCKGVGRVTCPRCQGRQRITVARGQSGSGEHGALPATAATRGAKPAVATTAGTQVEAASATALVPCPECQGTGGLRCKQCDGVSRLVQHKTVQWRRHAVQMETNDDLPRVDEQWLQRTCKPREVYKERHKGAFRPEWQLVPGLSDLVKEAEKRLDPNTRVSQSEVVISIIPVTEIVFDLGDAPTGAQPTAAQPAKGKGKPARAPEAGLYRWHIYGFERRLPKDWRFLNWDRVAWALLSAAVLVLAVLLVLMVLR
jgi:eukaryotic-like serine/threonine-protein kinase